jgi:ABC-type Zn2+ transport system substrate-binding protein/surface adhesin
MGLVVAACGGSSEESTTVSAATTTATTASSTTEAEHEDTESTAEHDHEHTESTAEDNHEHTERQMEVFETAIVVDGDPSDWDSVAELSLTLDSIQGVDIESKAASVKVAYDHDTV